jgi:integrase
MNSESKLKVFKSIGYDYLYVYYKLGKNMLRIPTGEQVVKGKMTKDLLFNSKVEDFERKNKEILELKLKVNAYIMAKSREYYPTISQKECKKFLQEFYMRGDLMSGKKYVPLQPLPILPDSKPLIKYIEDYIEYRKARSTPRNTLKEFTTVKNRLKGFDDDRKHATYFEDINIIWSDEFERYLLKKNYNKGTIEKSYTILITVLYHYYERKDGLKINLPDKFTFSGFKRGEKSKNKANPLTFEQFDTLFKHKFEENYLELTKIRFCLQCSTGIRFGDINRITKENIDSERIILIPKKTERHNIKAEIDFNPYSKAILEQLDFNTTSLKIENAPYNRNIKIMFAKMQEKYPDLKYQSIYGSHNARDTFISIAVQAGVDFKTILTWTGQSSYSIMDRYISTTNEYKTGQMKKAFK